MYQAFHDFLSNYGYNDNDIFDAFHTLCSDSDLYMHKVLLGEL